MTSTLLRSSSCVALLALGACTKAAVGFHELTDYRAHYAAQHGSVPTSDEIHGANIMANLRTPQDRPEPIASRRCSLAFAISGGGSISAAYSFGVLREMADWDLHVQHSSVSLLSQVDYISTASGGGITGAILAGTFWEKDVYWVLQSSPFDVAAFQNAVRVHFDSADYESSFSEAYLRRSEFLWTDNQTRLLRFRERLPIGVFGKNFATNNCELALTFDDMFAPLAISIGRRVELAAAQHYESARKFAPTWIPNATAFADGSRVPLTSAVLERLGVLRLTTPVRCSESARFRDWPMSEALAASMSFPGIGPFRLSTASGSLDLVDGGLADNLGVFTALDVVNADLARSRGSQPDQRGLIIVIDSSTDAESGMFAGSGTGVPDSEYLLEYGLTEFFAQYQVARAALDAAAPRIEHIFINARDARDSLNDLALCDGLSPTSGKEAGGESCPPGTRSLAMRVGDFVKEQRTSAAIDYRHADGLMQLGRRQARAVRNRIEQALERCMAPTP